MVKYVSRIIARCKQRPRCKVQTHGHSGGQIRTQHFPKLWGPGHSREHNFFFLCTVNFRGYANLGIIFKLVLLFNTLLTDSVRLLVYYIFTYVFYYTFGQLLLTL